MITVVDRGCSGPGPKIQGATTHLECTSPGLAEIVHEYKELFQSIPGSTDVAQHFIPTIGTPVEVPPCRIPACYHQEVESQLQNLMDQGIIEESSRPWMAPQYLHRL